MASPRWVVPIIEFARAHLDGRIVSGDVSPNEITDRPDSVAPARVQKLIKAMRHGWPELMPPIWVEDSRRGSGYLLLDGHHRTNAAEACGIDEIPAWIVPEGTYTTLRDEFDLERLDFIKYVAPVLIARGPGRLGFGCFGLPAKARGQLRGLG